MLQNCEPVHPESLCIVMPAYNEERNIRKVVEDWYRVVANHNHDGSSRLVVVNDGSTDGTQRVLHALTYTHPLLRVIDKPNGGHGSAVIRGYQEAVRIGADYVFQTDSDGQTMPSNFDKFWRRRHQYDAQFGWRKHRGDGIGRALTEHVLCTLLWLFFGVSVPDANAPFRLMKSWHLKQYLERLPKQYALPNVILTTWFVHDHWRVRFVPIIFRPRQHGVNTMNVQKLFRIGWQSLKDFAVFRKDMKRRDRAAGGTEERHSAPARKT